MATIKKKTWPEYFEAILSGKKKFDMRLADFDIQEGDTLLLEEWDPKNKDKYIEKNKKSNRKTHRSFPTK